MAKRWYPRIRVKKRPSRRRSRAFLKLLSGFLGTRPARTDLVESCMTAQTYAEFPTMCIRHLPPHFELSPKSLKFGVVRGIFGSNVNRTFRKKIPARALSSVLKLCDVRLPPVYEPYCKKLHERRNQNVILTSILKYVLDIKAAKPFLRH